jgi:hypothetical protein
MILDITAHQNIDDYYNISMPSTHFNKLDINIIDFRPGGNNEASCDIVEEEEVNVKYSINNNIDGELVHHYYRTYIPSNTSTTSRIHHLNLVHTCNSSCQYKDSDMIIYTASNINSRITFRIQCSSINNLTLSTGLNKGFKYALLN